MTWNPARLDVLSFAQSGARMQMTESLDSFPRLLDEIQPEHAALAQGVQIVWHMEGEMRPSTQGGSPTVWLRVAAHTELPLVCQRCLEASQTAIAFDRWFRFVADETTAEAEDSEAEEDVLALEPKPNVRELIEDELLMELPLIPLHDTCPNPLEAPAPRAEADPCTAEQPAEMAHPFAALAKLKQ